MLRVLDTHAIGVITDEPVEVAVLDNTDVRALARVEVRHFVNSRGRHEVRVAIVPTDGSEPSRISREVY